MQAPDSVDAPSPEAVGRVVALTPRGEAVVALSRLHHLLAALDADDRAYVVECLTEIVVETR